MTTPTVQPDPTDLLRKALEATTSPALRDILTAILASEARSLFTARTFVPEDLVFGFGAAPAFWIVAEGQAFVERRSSQGRGLRPRCVKAGGVLGAVPGGHERAWPPVVDAYARAITSFSAAVLPQDAFPALLRACQGIARDLAFVDLRERVSGVVEQQLRAVPGLAYASSETLANLLARAHRRELGDGEVLLEQGVHAPAFYVVLQGTVLVRRRHDDGEIVENPAGAGQVLALPSVVGQIPTIESFVGQGPVLLAELPAATWRGTLAAHPALRRGVQTLLPAETFDLVLVQSDVPGAPLAEATSLLARALREDFADDTVIVRLVRPTDPEPPADPGGTPTLVVRCLPEEAPAKIRAALAARATRRGAADALFLHPDPAWVAAAAPVVSRVAWLTAGVDTFPGGPLRQTRLDRAALLAPVGQATVTSWPTGTVRLRLDFAAVRARAHDRTRLATGPDAATATVQGLRRWARALTERLVGIALGGGGSPGFAHIALIRALETRARLPIDMVAGTSFGALVGAWYSGVRQLDIRESARLQTMLAAGRKLNLCLTVGMLDTNPLARLVDRQFKGLHLADLERPFYPVSSEVDSGTVYVAREASLGQGVQMSGAFPPFFPPVLRRGNARLVDGGFVNNVPASVLRTEGASFVLASNSIGLLPPRRRDQEPGPIRDAAAALNPFGRLQDAIRAGLMLFHRIGDTQALAADASFESAFTGIAFWDFNRGQSVIDKVQADADAFADRVALGVALHGKKGNVRPYGTLA